MAQKTVCDGCGIPAEGTSKLGIIDQLDYCETCVVVARKFVEMRDRLHEDICREWQSRLNSLVEEAKKKLPAMRLPDVE